MVWIIESCHEFDMDVQIYFHVATINLVKPHVVQLMIDVKT